MNRPVWGGFCHPPLCCFGFLKGGGGEEGGQLGGGLSREDETVFGGCLGQVSGLSGPRPRRGRALALSLSPSLSLFLLPACVRLVISLDSCGCVFPSFLACKLPSLLTSLLPRLPSVPPPCPGLFCHPLPVLLSNSGRRGGRPPARSSRWLSSTGLGPLDSLPPSRDFEGKMQSNSSVAFNFF